MQIGFKTTVFLIFCSAMLLKIMNALSVSTSSNKAVFEDKTGSGSLLREKRSPSFKKLWSNLGVNGGDRYYHQYNNIYSSGPGHYESYRPSHHWSNNQGKANANAQSYSGSFGAGDLQAVFSGASASASSSHGSSSGHYSGR